MRLQVHAGAFEGEHAIFRLARCNVVTDDDRPHARRHGCNGHPGALRPGAKARSRPPTDSVARQEPWNKVASARRYPAPLIGARLELRRHDGRRERLDLAADAGAYSCEGPPANFVELILGKTTVNHSPGESAMRSVLLLDAAYRSAASGRVGRV